MKITKLICFFLLLTVCTQAQHKGNYNQDISRRNITTGNAIVYGQSPKHITQNLNPSSTIIIDVRALQNVKASTYTAIFNVSQIGKTAETTNQLMNARISNIKQELAFKGISEKDIAIDVISFVPVYEVEVTKKLFSKTYTEVPKGFELQQNIHIKFTKTQQFENILTACAKNEIYNLVKVDYFIENIAEVYKNLQTKLLALIADKKDYYNLLGFKLDDYNAIIADQKYCYFPKDFYQHYQAYNSISFQALNKDKGITEVKKQTSYYYQPLSYEKYDIVINPSILEPVVQIGMEIKLHFTPKPKEQKAKPIVKTEIKHKYYVISPDGNIDIKELNTNI
ncbi:SIMPL domain-containing protein [Olleya sp. HaHaR_3_96]|uniref:SIMPL domain-containing protein n=1 Tax=Olleya sp. HaHaR_3_96 TaxID=2745560 RepID=UPI001C4FA7C9|nr:SIMPL domain-containing protein [Olleya sp. HaHaR_3_96]QXP60178.1 SIMPL domain-containing protein [Olleya sp. HaHaR_3_96]